MNNSKCMGKTFYTCRGRLLQSENTVIKEITASKFDDSFRIEAYLMNFEGFSGNGELLTQFGIRNNDEVNLVISKERYNEFILPKMSMIPQSERKSISRPAEGDLIYFPLDESLFEIKYVEGKKPFINYRNFMFMNSDVRDLSLKMRLLIFRIREILVKRSTSLLRTLEISTL